MTKRKYVGVPTQEEIIQQYNELVEMTKDITTLDQILKLQEVKPNDGYPMEIEINYNPISRYNNEPMEVIRYEYKNILVYADIDNNKVKHNPMITLYDDDGGQFADELYNNYTEEIERVAEMGLLELTQ